MRVRLIIFTMDLDFFNITDCGGLRIYMRLPNNLKKTIKKNSFSTKWNLEVNGVCESVLITSNKYPICCQSFSSKII